MTRHAPWLPWRRIRPWLFLAAGEIVAASLLAIPDARVRLPTFLAWAAVGSLLAVFAARSLSASSPAFLLLCGGLLRATLLLRPPDLSDDVTRYLWDARVADAGISPYAYPPADPALAALDPGLRARVPHSDVRTVYPPVAQAVFRLGRAISPGAFGLKALVAAADLSIVALLLALGGPGAGFAAALYAFHPLAIFESAGEGHVDSVGVALLLASIVFVGQGRNARAGVALALSALTKYVAVFAALPLLRRGRIRFAAAGLAIAASILAAWTRGGVWPVGGLPDYARRWEFNSLPYSALTGLFERLDLPARAKTVFEGVKRGLGHPDWLQPIYAYFYAGFLARVTLAAALLGFLLFVARRVRDTETAVFASLAAVLLVSPTLQPWYLLWVLPLAARRREPAFLYLSSAVFLSYGLLYPPPSRALPSGVLLSLEYGPFLILLVHTLLRARPAGSPEEAA